MASRSRTGAKNRRGVATVPMYNEVDPEAKAKFDALAAATGSRKNRLIEAIIDHIETDEHGMPTWWEPIPDEDEDQGKLDMAM